MRSCRLGRLIGGCLWLVLLADCGDNSKWHSIDVSGSLPPLSFTLTRAEGGKTVTEADYRGRIVLLYFGYTFCPDICPTTLANLDDVLARLGPDAEHVRVLFVTVDPNRDTPAVLAAYVKNFGPQVDGLRGSPDQLAALARRYRVAYSVSPATADHPYEVTHGSAVYVFDGADRARLIIPSLASAHPDIAGAVADLQRLAAERQTAPGWLAWLRRSI
jgi:protein SCO1/2